VTAKEPLDQHDKQIAAIRNLVQEGMRLVVETGKDIRTLALMQRATAVAQQRTEEKLQALIDSLRRGGNGHKGRVEV
jgi:hypothetical protein